MKSVRITVSVVLAVLMSAVGLEAASSAPSATSAAPSSSVTTALGGRPTADLPLATRTGVMAENKKPKKPRKFRAASGVLFNNPYGGSEPKYRLNHQIVSAINTVPSGGKIRIATWNLQSRGFGNALVRAHERGVSVRIVMDQINWGLNPNPEAERLKNVFAKNRGKRPASRRSWIRKCQSSCRGRGGIAHSKFYAFSRVGRDRHVVMFGSNNFTPFAASIQWNDMYIVKNKKDVYDAFVKVVRESGNDTPLKQAYRTHRFGPKLSVQFYPHQGKNIGGDPAAAWLRNIKCKGATGSAGVRGRTQIRIAQTAMYGDRGNALARQLAGLARAGCNIKVVYAMFGNDTLGILRNAGIPLVHLAVDFNEDGDYDRYVHMKAMAVSGVYGDETEAHVVFNGAANWSPYALDSDEEVGIIRRKRVVNQYIRWIDGLRRPASWGEDRDVPDTSEQRVGQRDANSAPMGLVGEVA